MRAVGVFLGLIIMVAAGAWWKWPLDPLQLGFVGAGLLIEGVIIWAYFTSPPLTTEAARRN